MENSKKNNKIPQIKSINVYSSIKKRHFLNKRNKNHPFINYILRKQILY